MNRRTLNPLTALFQSSLPLTLEETLDHIERTSQDGGDVARTIEGADWSWLAGCHQSELVDRMSSDYMGFALACFLGRAEPVDPLVAAAAWMRHFDQAPSLTHEQRAECLRTVNHLRAALRQILASFHIGATRAADALSIPGQSAPSPRALAVMACELAAEIHAWDVLNPDCVSGEVAEGARALALQGIADPLHGSPLLQELAGILARLAPARDQEELKDALSSVRTAWAQHSLGTGGTLTVEQAARIAGRSEMSILRWLAADPKLGRKVDGRWEVDAEVLREHVEEKRRAA